MVIRIIIHHVLYSNDYITITDEAASFLLQIYIYHIIFILQLVHERIEAAYEIELDWDNSLPPGIAREIKNQTACTGSPPETLMVPLFTVTLGMLHQDTTMKISNVSKVHLHLCKTKTITFIKLAFFTIH